LAIENEHITADVIEVSEFIDLAQRYQVQGVPKTVINERFEFGGPALHTTSGLSVFGQKPVLPGALHAFFRSIFRCAPSGVLATGGEAGTPGKTQLHNAC